MLIVLTGVLTVLRQSDGHVSPNQHPGCRGRLELQRSAAARKPGSVDLSIFERADYHDRQRDRAPESLTRLGTVRRSKIFMQPGSDINWRRFAAGSRRLAADPTADAAGRDAPLSWRTAPPTCPFLQLD